MSLLRRGEGSGKLSLCAVSCALVRWISEICSKSYAGFRIPRSCRCLPEEGRALVRRAACGDGLRLDDGRKAVMETLAR